MIFDDYYCETCNTIKEIIKENLKDNFEYYCETCGKLLKKKFNTLPVHYKGNGWASKGSSLLSNPKRYKAEEGVRVDYDKKNSMKESGEI